MLSLSCRAQMSKSFFPCLEKHSCSPGLNDRHLAVSWRRGRTACSRERQRKVTSASSAHVFLAKHLWRHRGAAFHPQHVFRARRRQHRRGFETPAHNLKLSDTARGGRKAAADKGNESCAIAVQNCHHWACSAGWAWLPAPLLPPCGVTGP